MESGNTPSDAPAAPASSDAPGAPPTAPEYGNGFTPAQVAGFLTQMSASMGETEARRQLEAEGFLKPGDAPQSATPGAPNANAGGNSKAAVSAYLATIEATPPEDASEYRIPRLTGDPKTSPAAFAQADASIRSMLSEGLFTSEIGSSLAQDAASFVQMVEGMNPQDRARLPIEFEGTLKNMWGENYAGNLALTRQFIAELDRKTGGKLVPFLEESGLGNSTKLAAQIHAHAKRLSGRWNATK